MADLFKLYDQFTTKWEKVRAAIISHVIAALLLWAVGFDPPLPPWGLSDLQGLPQASFFPLLENIGILATLSFAAAFAIAAYAVLLGRIGSLLLSLLQILVPLTLDPAESRSLLSRNAPFVIASTLDSGTYQGDAIRSRFSELVAVYQMIQPDVFKANTLNSELQRDATTYLRNGLVFVIAWCAIPIVWDGTALAAAVDQVFWRGLLLLIAFVLIARARLRFAWRVTVSSLFTALGGLIQKDPAFAEKLANARRNPGPYDALVTAFLKNEAYRPAPSLRSHWQEKLGLARAEGPRRESRLDRWAAFGRNRVHNENHDDPAWLLRYLRWKLAVLIRRLGQSVKVMLVLFGLRAP